MSATGKTEAQAGFTLIETLVVLAVIALISSLAFPAIDRALNGERLRAEVGRTAEQMHAARNGAIARSEDVPFQPGEATEGFSVIAEEPLVFHGDGSASGGPVLIRARSGPGRAIEVGPLTGQIRVKPL